MLLLAQWSIFTYPSFREIFICTNSSNPHNNRKSLPVCNFPISCLQIKFWPRFSVTACDPALTLTGTLVYAQTAGGSKIWPWPYQPHLHAGQSIVRAASFHASSVWVCQLLSRVWLCDPMDCSWSGSSVHGILQARILEWVAIPFFRGSFNPGIKPMSQSPALAGSFFITWATGEPLIRPEVSLAERVVHNISIF